MKVVLVALLLVTVACSSSEDDEGARPAETSADADCTPARSAEAGSERLTFDHDGVDREYELTVPPDYDGTTAAPLLLSLHGFTSNIEQQDAVSNFTTAATERGYVVVTPQARPVNVPLGPDGIEAPLWNIIPGFTDTPAASGQEQPEAEDDVGFLTSLLDHLTSEQLCIDIGRVYVSGISNGAGMTDMLICEEDSRFAAAAPVAGVNLLTHCEATEPTPVIAFHGDADPLISYEGGSMFGFDLGLPSVPQRMTDLAVTGGCDPEPNAEQPFDDVEHSTWTCPEGMAAELYTVAGGGHTWPGATAYAPPDNAQPTSPAAGEVPGGMDLADIMGHTTENISATDLMLDFFDAHHR
jgi:polyhydroxybutyrate depolymerase